MKKEYDFSNAEKNPYANQPEKNAIIIWLKRILFLFLAAITGVVYSFRWFAIYLSLNSWLLVICCIIYLTVLGFAAVKFRVLQFNDKKNILISIILICVAIALIFLAAECTVAISYGVLMRYFFH